MADTTSFTQLILTAYTGKWLNPVFRNRTLFDFLPPQEDPVGSTNYRWNVQTAGLTASAFVENDLFSAASQSTQRTAALPWAGEQHQSTFNITDEVWAVLQKEGSTVPNSLAIDADNAMLAVIDARHTAFLATTGIGILNAVDGTTTYAGIAHTVVGWDPYEPAAVGTLAISDFQDMERTIRDAERAGNPDFILASPTQIENYLQLAGVGASGSPVQIIGAPNEAVNVNVGWQWTNVQYSNMRFVSVPDLTNTEILMIQKADWGTFYQDHGPMSRQGFKVIEVPRAGHGQDVNVSYRCIIACHMTHRQGKLSGVTA